MTVFLVYFKYLKNYIGGKMSSPQIQNALQTVNRLVLLVEDAERHFKSARNWSFLDVLGGGFLTFADFFFDGVFVDAYMTSKIMNSLDEVQKLKERLYILKSKLEQM